MDKMSRLVLITVVLFGMILYPIGFLLRGLVSSFLAGWSYANSMCRPAEESHYMNEGDDKC